jgi:serine/threonine-protein kinase
LKPANVMVDGEGRVKVLDFGLAKALADESPDAPEASNSPTLTRRATAAGSLLGTAAYMSPEQARGRPADRRSDIWAFGVLLWEMLSGKALFTGETVSDVLASVLRTEIDFSGLPSSTPPAIHRLLRRCLTRDARHRLRDIADARLDIAEGAAGVAEPVAPRGARLGRGAAGLVIAALALAAVAGWLTGSRSGRPPEAPIRLTLPLPDGYRVSARVRPAVAISRDGRRQVVVAYGLDGVDLLVARDLAELEARVLQGTAGAHTPSLSPDGAWVGFVADGELRRIRFEGGPVERLAAAPEARGASWSASGTIFFAPRSEGGLFRLSPEIGSEPVAITHLDAQRGERTHRWPHALPDGRHVLFTCDTVDSPQAYDDARLEAVDVASGKRKVLMEGTSRGVYASSGHLLFARAGNLFAVSFDAARLEVTGEPQLVVQGMSSNIATGAAQLAVSGTGDLLYVPGQADLSLRRPVWAKGKDAVEPSSIPPERYFHLALAPDGRRVALTRLGERRNDVWIGDIESGILNRLTFQGGMSPVWTPDGRRIAYQRSSTATYAPQDSNEVLWKAADGSDEEEVLWKSDMPIMTNHFSPDGKWLIVSRSETPTAASSPTEAGLEPPAGAPVSRDAVAGAADLWLVPLDGGQPRLLFGAPGFQYAAEFSPDGRWLAYLSDESGRHEVYVRRFPGPGGRRQVSANGGAEPHWSKDGRAIYYRQRHELLRVPVELRGESFTAGPAVPVAGVQIASANPRTYGITADGRILFLVHVADNSDAGSPVLVRGFARELERLVQ